MKKSELVEIIRTLVKEEVNNLLPQILMEVLAEKISENTSILESNKSPSPKKKPNFNVGLDEPIKKQSIPIKSFAKNPILNQVLNETVGGIPSEEEVSSQSALDVINSLPKEKLNENKEVAAVASALTRNYSSLLKAVDEKAKAKRPL